MSIFSILVRTENRSAKQFDPKQILFDEFSLSFMVMLKRFQIATNGDLQFFRYISRGIKDVLNSSIGVGTGCAVGTCPLFPKFR